MPTLLDIITLNNSDKEVGLIEEVVPFVPEIAAVPARPIKGLNFYTTVRTALPTVAFRNANEGTASTKSTFEKRLVECFIMNPDWVCDVAVADSYEDGPEAYIAIEAVGITKAAFITLGKQFYYGAGTGGDAKGHPGLIQAYDSTNMVVDAGGTTATTGSSVWAVSYGPQAVTWVFGNNAEFAVSDAVKQRIADPNDATKALTAYCQNLLTRPGLQVSSIYSVGRIKKLTADNNCGLDDDKLSDLLSKFPVGHKPDAFFMSRRSLKQLQQSRTATNATGAPAPIPTEAFGVPIQVTDSILDTEALTL
jgi:hypothetical protein